MNRTTYIIELSFLSGVLAVIRTFFGTIHTSYIILLLLIGLDTITGMCAALKYKRFNSRGLYKLIKKSLTYTAAIITIKLLEVGIITLVETSFLSQIIVAFLQITETISILENLTLLGVPLPKNFIDFLLRNIAIPGLSGTLQIARNKQRDICEIDNIINHQVPTLNDKYIKELLIIRFNFWKKMIMNVIRIFEDSTSNDNKHLYYKMMSIMQVELKDMKGITKEADIPENYINLCEKTYRTQVDKWLNKIRDICFSDMSKEEKKSKIINSIVVLSYETMLNAHRIFNH